MKLHARGKRNSTVKALALLLSLALALVGFVYWQWKPIQTILYLIGFALA